MSKKHISYLDRVHLFAFQKEGDGSIQHETEGIIKMVEDITICSIKQTSILIFSSSCFL